MLRIFYLFLIFELFLGGGGRLLEAGSFTLRMVIFGFAVFVMLFLIIRHRQPAGMNLAFLFAAAFILLHLEYALIGILSGTEMAVVLGEIKPLLYFLITPFFAYVLSNTGNVVLTSKAVRFSGFILALFYAITLLGLYFGFWNFSTLYEKFSSTEEFMFRGWDGLFVYKGFLYLCISLIFWVDYQGKYFYARGIAVTMISAALFLTLTRGFLISTIISIVIYLFLIKRYKIILLFFATGFFLLLVTLNQISIDGMEFLIRKDSDISDITRYQDIAYMIDNSDAYTFFMGHGFGSMISDTRLNIENSYLWIWWKMGIQGLIFWMSPLFLAVISMREIPFNSRHHSLAAAYFCGTVLVYVQSLANPYLTNPIGLSFVIIAIFSLRTIVRSTPRKSSLIGRGAVED